MLTRSLILFACLTLAAGAIARAERSESVPPRAPLAAFPMQIGEWRGVQEPPFEASILKVLGVDEYLTRAYFRAESRRRRAVHRVLPKPASGRHDALAAQLPAGLRMGADLANVRAHPGGRRRRGRRPLEITINRYVVQKGLDRQLVLYWYQAHGRVIASEYWSKFYLIRDAVRLNRTDGALVRVIAPVLGDARDAEARAEAARHRVHSDVCSRGCPRTSRNESDHEILGARCKMSELAGGRDFDRC